MKKKVLFSLLSMFVCYNTSAQNLIRNPRLDSMLWCPMDLQQFGGQFPVLGWIEEGSTDYFNSCASGVTNAPNAYFGYAPGDAYCGFLGASRPNSTDSFFSGERMKTRIPHIFPGTIVRVGARLFFSTPPFQQGPSSSIQFILSAFDTIQTPLINQSQWILFDTTVTLIGDVDTLVIGAGGIVSPYNGSPYYGYYYVDSIFLELMSLPNAIDEPKDDHHHWENIYEIGPVHFLRCNMHGEVKKVTKFF